MHIVMFYHSLVSDWNHGNAHFLRGIATELIGRGHRVDIYEPRDGWSFSNLMREKGPIALRQFRKTYPLLKGRFYDPLEPDLDQMLKGADLVIVHEWNEHNLVKEIGEHRKKSSYALLFHDTHHRSVTDPVAMGAYDLSGFDGILAYGKTIRDIYLENRWAKRAWVWHEAADVQVFQPLNGSRREGDIVWIGNWGDEERTEEIIRYFIEPVRKLGLKAMVYGVRYPQSALRLLETAGIQYGGWLPNFQVPKVFSRYGVTVHIPRRPYAKALPGIPTIRPFEALACGIPLVSAPWEDCENLFRGGSDFLYAGNGREMTRLIAELLRDRGGAARMASRGVDTIVRRHTCSHRVDELLGICTELGIRRHQQALPERVGGKGIS